MELTSFVEPLITIHQKRAEALKVSSWIFKSSGILLHVDQFTLKTETMRFNRNFGKYEWFKIFAEELGNIQVFCDITLLRIPDHEYGRNSLFQNVGILTKWNLRLSKQSFGRFKFSGILGCSVCLTMNINYAPMERQYIDHTNLEIHIEKLRKLQVPWAITLCRLFEHEEGSATVLWNVVYIIQESLIPYQLSPNRGSPPPHSAAVTTGA